MAPKYPAELLSLVAHLKKLPGVGTRTAERFAFEFLRWPVGELVALGETLKGIRDKLPPCSQCGCLTDGNACSFCDLSERDPSQLCLLSSPRDAYAIEETKSYRGLYHVVEHLLSPLDGRKGEGLDIGRIKKRIEQQKVKEIIVALDSTLEGDTTALYLKSRLSDLSLPISRLALGLPIGSSLESVDGGTLALAFQGRQSF